MLLVWPVNFVVFVMIVCKLPALSLSTPFGRSTSVTPEASSQWPSFRGANTGIRRGTLGAGM